MHGTAEGVPTEEEIGRRIAAAMELAQLDQKKTARLLRQSGAKISDSTFSRMLKKGMGLTVPRLVLLAVVLAGKGYLGGDFRKLLLYLQGVADEIPMKKKEKSGS